MKFRVLIILVMISVGLNAQIIPSSRMITWQGNVGIPGGVPNRTTIFTNMTTIDNTGSSDVTAAIQYALNHCPSNQVVYLPAGTFRLNSQLNLTNSGVTLRGAGPTNTILSGHGTGAMVAMGGPVGLYVYYQWGTVTTPTAASSGYTVGSTSLVVASASGISKGMLMNIDQLNPSYVDELGNEGYNGNGSRTTDGNGGGTREVGQVVKITGVSGTTITFDPPLFCDFTNTPQVVAYHDFTTMSGIEELQLYANNSGYDYNLTMFTCSYCWAKNIQGNYADGSHLVCDSAVRCEIRDSYFHDGYSHTSGSHDDELNLRAHSSGCLVENNIFRRMHVSIILEWGGGGHVIGYNYSTNNFDSGAINAVFSDIIYHGSHPINNLFEGNVMNVYNSDGVWGSASSGTLLRNVLTGQNYNGPPYTGRSAEGLQTNKEFQSARAINLSGVGRSLYFNAVGNVLGVSTMGNYPAFNPIYLLCATTNRDYDHAGLVFSLGYGGGSDTGTGSGDNSQPLATLLNTGNWNVVSNAILWDANGVQTIPDSYYLTGKPDWFGTLTYPAVNPASPTTSMNPAEYLWLNGTNPPNGGGATTYNIQFNGGGAWSGSGRISNQ